METILSMLGSKTTIIILGCIGIIASYGFAIVYIIRIVIRHKNREKTRKKYLDEYLERRRKRYERD